MGYYTCIDEFLTRKAFDMKIYLHRFEFGDHYTIGKLFIDDRYVCYTLEDRTRAAGAPKVPGQTAIPAGTYKVIIDMSTRFKKPMLHVLDVPGFEGIRIHSGNTDKDTEGCILVGMQWAGTDFIGMSQVALGQVFGAVQTALNKGESVSIEIAP